MSTQAQSYGLLRPLIFASLAVLGTYLLVKLRYKRFTQYAHLPQLPPSLLLGHLKTMDEYIRRGRADRHPDMIFADMHQALGRPPLMLVDLRPVNRPMVLVTNHEIAEQVSKASTLFPTSVPKSDLRYLEHITGATSILAVHGDQWKTLRKRFNPGFAPQNLFTLLPCILDKTLPFVSHLDRLASTGEAFPIAPLIINLTFDIIGSVIMDVDLNAQATDPSARSELVQLFHDILGAYSDDKADLPWWLIPGTERKRRRLGRRIDMLVKGVIANKFTEQRNQSKPVGKPRSILALSLGNTQDLSPDLLAVTCDQLKTFLLAGHDTTSVTLAWVFYELSLNPSELRAVRAELDALLGPDSSVEAVKSRLLMSDGQDIINKMGYCSAVIKETLRLHPPAATARYAKSGSGFKVTTPSGQEVCLDDVIIYNCESIMHRDTSVYGESANRFLPERWLESDQHPIPPSAWRPFERGPRNCIGQEFATIEARVILACTARRYDFVKVGMGSITGIDKQGTPEIGDPLYNTRQISSKPVDGMRVRVKLASPNV
ncbi:cytochrome P450 [Xylariaceae sp. FL1019]|nr:cytochrome P450 [Xylariaceae sp. FL1019]